MCKKTDYVDRKALIHLLNGGKSPQEAAQELDRSLGWVYKWKSRFEQESWEGLLGRSRVPHHIARQTSAEVKREILKIRSDLEAEAENEESLGYIGADAIYGRLQAQRIEPMPAVSTIERILRQSGRTHPRLPKSEKEVVYPHLNPTKPHQLTQVDIVPRYLTGGQSVACFNSIDVVSRYPAGKQYAQKRSVDAIDFILHTWREVGISEYLQMDNESCFCGGYKHPGVIGKVVRLALFVGVQPVFSPFYHPQSNAFVERFHQDYADFVWKKTHLENLAAVRQRSTLFFPNYRNSHHHSALAGRSPAEVHRTSPACKLPLVFSLPNPLPITAGQVHFLRAMDEKHNVRILNKTWSAGMPLSDQGVWATLSLKPGKATLRIYDAAPDAPKRRCLIEHPFPLSEPVSLLQTQFTLKRTRLHWWQIPATLFKRPVLTPSTMS
jgi:transposase InsO family protein